MKTWNIKTGFGGDTSSGNYQKQSFYPKCMFTGSSSKAAPSKALKAFNFTATDCVTCKQFSSQSFCTTSSFHINLKTQHTSFHKAKKTIITARQDWELHSLLSFTFASQFDSHSSFQITQVCNTDPFILRKF